MKAKLSTSFTHHEYANDDVFKRDLSLLATQWTFVEHISSFPELGSYRVHRLHGESIILVRTEQGMRGYFNFCRHRGAQICSASQGKLERFVCPYHNWTYALEGDLVHVTGMYMNKEQKADYGLREIGIQVYEGCIFVALQPLEACQFDVLEKILTPLLPWQGLVQAKVACRRSYPTKGNWKLVVENFLECFHCFPNHPELCSVYSHPKLSGSTNPALANQFLIESAEWERNTRDLGYPTGGVSTLDAQAKQFCVAFRVPIQRGFSTLSVDGKPVAPLMGLFEEYDGGETFGFVGPMFHFSLANDHAMLIRINPVSPLETEIELIWLVDADAIEEQDYQPEQVAWLWDATVKQDRALVESAQIGSTSQYYVPGPYTDLEAESARFANWYRAWHARHAPTQ